MQCSGSAFTGQHDDIGGKFHGYSKGQNDTADQKADDFYRICLWIQPEKQIFHGKINEIAKQDRYWNLEQLDQLKIFPEQHDLQGNQKQTENDGKLSKGQRKL